MCNNNCFGGNNCLWIIILLILFCGCGNTGGCGMTMNNGGCGGASLVPAKFAKIVDAAQA